MDSKLYTEEEMLKFVDMMCSEKEYTKVYRFGELEMVYRTRTGEEALEIIKLPDIGKTDVEISQNLTIANLACTIKTLGTESLDKGTLAERIARLRKMPLPKLMVLIDRLKEFNEHVEDLRKNFALFCKAQ